MSMLDWLVRDWMTPIDRLCARSMVGNALYWMTAYARVVSPAGVK